MAREVIDTTTTPEGQTVELAREGEAYVIRVGGLPLMSSAAQRSEQHMATLAREQLGDRPGARVLVGGLGMGFTLRAALDAFDADARLVVAELMPAVVAYNRGPLGPLAGAPLEDRRVRLHEGDVRELFAAGAWDAVLLDVDNGPYAFTAEANAGLYDEGGAHALATALRPGGVLVVWSAYESEGFRRGLEHAGLGVEVCPVAPTPGARPDHLLFVGRKV